MRSAIVAAACFAGSLAIPHQAERRALEAPPAYGGNIPPVYGGDAPPADPNNDPNVVYVTQVITVTAGADGPPAAYAPQATSAPHRHKHKHNKAVYTTTSVVPAPAYTPVINPIPALEPPVSDDPVNSDPVPEVPVPEVPAVGNPPTYEATSSAPAAPAYSPPPSSDSPTYSGPDQDYVNMCLEHHNVHRANHTNTPPVSWSALLAESAQNTAETCIYEHNVDKGPATGYGQNIAAGIQKEKVAEIISNMFYNSEIILFMDEFGKTSPNMDKFEGWGHFTQMCWSGSIEIGCYTADCSGRGLANVGDGVSPHFTVCNYNPPGNYADEYANNVHQPLGHPTVSYNDAPQAPSY